MSATLSSTPLNKYQTFEDGDVNLESDSVRFEKFQSRKEQDACQSHPQTRTALSLT